MNYMGPGEEDYRFLLSENREPRIVDEGRRTNDSCLEKHYRRRQIDSNMKKMVSLASCCWADLKHDSLHIDCKIHQGFCLLVSYK